MIEVRQIDTNSINYLVHELEQFEKNKAIKSGLKAGGNVLKAGGRQRLKQRLISSKGTNNLLNSFRTRVKRNEAGVLTGFMRGKNGGNHSHLVDRGTKERKTKDGENRGVIPANYFWTDTENTDQPKAVNEIFAGVEKAVQQINNRKK